MNSTQNTGAADSAQHTPGPWGYNTEESADSASFLISDGELPIARVRISGARPLSELRANARLIAAAPHLLAALEELEWAHSRLLDSESLVLPGDDERLIHAGEIARAAIARSKGGAL